MEVILLEKVENLGNLGDVVNVRRGFARNYLLPKEKALQATEGNKKRFEAQRKAYEARQAELQLDNFRLVDKVPKETVPYLLGLSDVSVVHLRDDPLFETVIPSKMFEAMITRTPIVLGVRGEARSIVEGAEAGLFIPPEDPDALVEAVRHCLDGVADVVGGDREDDEPGVVDGLVEPIGRKQLRDARNRLIRATDAKDRHSERVTAGRDRATDRSESDHTDALVFERERSVVVRLHPLVSVLMIAIAVPESGEREHKIEREFADRRAVDSRAVRERNAGAFVFLGVELVVAGADAVDPAGVKKLRARNVRRDGVGGAVGFAVSDECDRERDFIDCINERRLRDHVLDRFVDVQLFEIRAHTAVSSETELNLASIVPDHYARPAVTTLNG